MMAAVKSRSSHFFLCLVTSALIVAIPAAGSEVLYKTLRSKAVTLPPGGVYRRFQPIPWAPGHIAIRSFNAELVDESGASVPLSDVYLHHWIVQRVLVKEDSEAINQDAVNFADMGEKIKLWPNAGTCENYALSQWFGVGSETRKTDTSFPAPYGVETGNPEKVPEGWREAWFVQIHAIDTRGTVNPSDCLECRCDAYNVTRSEHGHPLPEGYLGGLWCCYENVTCATKPGFPLEPKTYYLQYTIGYVPFDECVVPLRIYILDVTDNGLPAKTSDHNSCQVEYAVEPCDGNGPMGSCQHSMNRSIAFPDSGRLVFSVGHLHAGGVGATLWGEDNRLICDSLPIYGRGSQPGDEAGFVVGMGVCHHSSPSDRISAGEKLTLRSTYSSAQLHTGVMGLFYMAVAVDGDYAAPANHKCPPVEQNERIHLALPEAKAETWRLLIGGAIPGFLLGATLVAAIAAIMYTLHRSQNELYAPLGGA